MKKKKSFFLNSKVLVANFLFCRKTKLLNTNQKSQYKTQRGVVSPLTQTCSFASFQVLSLISGQMRSFKINKSCSFQTRTFNHQRSRTGRGSGGVCCSKPRRRDVEERPHGGGPRAHAAGPGPHHHHHHHHHADGGGLEQRPAGGLRGHDHVYVNEAAAAAAGFCSVGAFKPATSPLVQVYWELWCLAAWT